MVLQNAQSLLIRDRMDWNKPHLSWVPSNMYRYFRSVVTAR